MSYVPSERGWVEIKVEATLTALATVAVALRFCARVFRRLAFQPDDWFAFASLIFLANEFTYSITSPFVKLSLIIFYRRLFITPGFRQVTNILIGMCVAWGLATFIGSSLQCRPLKAYWDLGVEGQCFNTPEFIKGTQSVNVFLDTAILCLPIKPVWSLHRPWQDRLALSGVFVLGGLKDKKVLRFILRRFVDSLYDATLWTFVEPCIGLVCSCLPVIRSLFPTLKSKKTTKVSNSRPVELEGNSRSPLNSYNSKGQYIQMNDYSWDINGGVDEARNNSVPDHPGSITVERLVQVAA
ncbi:Satratoxin biosynthesis SC1 cluster protein [Lachnellula willkommii]|uniref:Satratoxin biosynthesis SC1 cluster protein n=1 Tax=Lachnellula willkommii TaxID=215461 RepID=A0A559MHS4_9HELO|nr:Satratoxin biosynthesis SC1 cluster protein [Lachnellula willkommii]